MELVSIIVPVYNVEKYLAECIESLLVQTYKNLEIILVDDGSKDSSGTLCDAFAKRDARIRVIHKENAGLGYARNSGLEIASGKYVTFIDSDDKADSDLIMRLMKPVCEEGVDTCIGGFKRITEDGRVEYTETYENRLYQGNEVYNDLFVRMLGSAPSKHDAVRMSVWNALYSMDLIREQKLSFPSEREFISEDIIWDSDYYKHAKRVKTIDSAAYCYRITPGSLTQKYRPNRFNMVCILYNEMCRRIGGAKANRDRLQRQFFLNLRVCLRQEKRSISGNPPSLYKNRIQAMLNNKVVREIMAEYPIKSIQFKQKVFLLLVKYRQVNILIAFIEIGLV